MTSSSSSSVSPQPPPSQPTDHPPSTTTTAHLPPSTEATWTLLFCHAMDTPARDQGPKRPRRPSHRDQQSGSSPEDRPRGVRRPALGSARQPSPHLLSLVLSTLRRPSATAPRSSHGRGGDASLRSATRARDFVGLFRGPQRHSTTRLLLPTPSSCPLAACRGPRIPRSPLVPRSFRCPGPPRSQGDSKFTPPSLFSPLPSPPSIVDLPLLVLGPPWSSFVPSSLGCGLEQTCDEMSRRSSE